MVNKVKDIGIKTRICYFHNDNNIKKIDPNNIKTE